MKIQWNRRDTTRAAYAFLVLALAILFHALVNNFHAATAQLRLLVRPLAPILWGFALSYILNPLMMSIEHGLERLGIKKVLGRRRRRAVTLVFTYLVALSVLLLFSLIVLPRVAANVATMYSQLQSYIVNGQKMVSDLLARIPPDLLPQSYIDQLSTTAGEMLQRLFNWMATSMPALVGLAWQFGSGIITTFVAVMVSIYLLFAKENFIAQLRKLLCAFLPRRKVNRIVEVTRTTHSMFGRFITGKVVDSIIIGGLAFVGLSVMRMPNVVLVSFIVGITNIIPYFGPFIGAVPGFFLVALVSPVQGLVFLVFILVLQQIDGNIIGPMILGDSTGLSAFWVVFAILCFGGWFGVFGMIIGVPTFGVLYVLLKELIQERLRGKGLSADTVDYMKPLDTSPNPAPQAAPTGENPPPPAQ